MTAINNRKYTGLLRTPPSMAWLIRERARLKGNIDRRLKILEQLPHEIAQLRAQLDALDSVIPLHEVKVDPQVIAGFREQGPRLTGYGEITRLILKFLQDANGAPRYTIEIVMAVCRELNIDLAQIPKCDVVERVGRRLRDLVQQGKLRRHHNPTKPGKTDGLWSLALG